MPVTVRTAFTDSALMGTSTYVAFDEFERETSNSIGIAFCRQYDHLNIARRNPAIVQALTKRCHAGHRGCSETGIKNANLENSCLLRPRRKRPRRRATQNTEKNPPLHAHPLALDEASLRLKRVL